jgi:hypothetical protein
MNRLSLGAATLLFPLGLVAACEPEFAGVPGSFETRSATASAEADGSEQQDDARWVVRASDERYMTELAITGDFIYWSAQWDGTYRTRKSGGPVEVVEAGSETLHGPLAVQGQDVFWMTSTFDEHDFPSVRVRRQRGDGSGSDRSSLFEGALTTYSSNQSTEFQADASGIYLTSSPRYPNEVWAVRKVVAGGGFPSPMLPVDDVWQTPIWAVGGGELFFSPCPRNDVQGRCELRRRTQAGVIETLAVMPAMDAAVRAVDAAAAYVTDSTTLWRVERAGGAVQQLYRDPSRTINPGIAIDAQHVYLLEGPGARGEGHQIRAVPRAGGETKVVARLGAHTQYLHQLRVDDTHLYLLHGQSQILRVSKTPAPPPAP